MRVELRDGEAWSQWEVDPDVEANPLANVGKTVASMQAWNDNGPAGAVVTFTDGTAIGLIVTYRGPYSEVTPEIDVEVRWCRAEQVTCGKRYECECWQGRHRCGRAPGHDGACGRG